MQRLFPSNAFVPPRIGDGLRLAVGEAPGLEESLAGEPFVGMSGGWLRGRADTDGKRTGGLYRKAGVSDHEITFCNTIQCRPPDNLYPTSHEARSYISKEDADKAVAHCKAAHVVPLLKARAWKRIDAIGAKALECLTGKTDGISRWRGSPLPVPELGEQPICVATIHPSAIARDQTLIPAVISDLKKSTIVAPEYYNTHPTLEEVKAFTATVFSFDIETSMDTGEVLCVGLCAERFHAMVVPCKGAYKDELKRIFENAEVLISQNGIAFDVPRLFPVLGLVWEHL